MPPTKQLYVTYVAKTPWATRGRATRTIWKNTLSVLMTDEPDINSDTCLNCKQELGRGRFCAQCGQKNIDRDVSIRTLFQDFIGDYFSFDSKLFRTLIPLTLKPGQVPLEFIEGKRVRHIPPMRSLVFISFIFFLVLGSLSDSISGSQNPMSSFSKELEDGLNSSEQRDVTLSNDIISLDFSDVDSSAQNGLIGQINAVNMAVENGVSPQAAVDSIAPTAEGGRQRLLLQWGKIRTAESSVFSKFALSNISILLLILQPFFALILYLLHFRKRKQLRFIRHLVFSLYFHAWVLLIGIVLMSMAEVVPVFSPFPIGVILSLVYLAMAMKRFYAQGWGKTLLKEMLIFLLYLGIIFPTFLALSLVISFLFF